MRKTFQVFRLAINNFVHFRVQEAFESSILGTQLKELLAPKLNQINFDGSARFAVRSSGVTEDGEESSAAGQNETFLGLKKNEDVFEAVIKCWASLYSFQSVQYRKYGEIFLGLSLPIKI